MNLLMIYSYLMLISFILFMLLSFYLYMTDLGIMMEWLLFSYNSINMEFFLMVDWISCLFISVVMLISSMIMLYSMIYMSEEKFLNRFMILVILFILSMILMIISPNLISILFGWDGLGLTSYCLVIFYHNYISYNSGMVTVLCNRIGDIGLLMSISMMFIYGSWSIYFMNSSMKLILMMMVLAAITKSAQIPFSVWLPLAMAAPTPVSALVHSSTLVTAGVYLMIRFNKILINSMMDKILLYLSIFTMFMSGLMANFENDLKKIIALSTLSQLGLMMMILSLGLNFLAFFHLLTHAIFKSLLFMCAGIMIHLMNNNQDIRFCGKMNEYIPFTMVSFYMANLALMGFPFLAGFYSKDLIMESIYLMNMNMFLLIMSMLSLSFTVSYSMRLFYYIYFGEVNSSSFYYYKENKLMNFSMIILMSLSMISGSLLIWIFFFDNYFMYMNINVKMMTMLMLLMGMILGYIVYFKNLVNLYLQSFFFSSMWFLNYMYLWIYQPFLIMGVEAYSLDKKWIEFMSKNLILSMVKEIKLNKNLYKIFMFIFIITFSLMVVYMII
uniref:NADH dehydrogenase subunit 5 n=1 Tax=Cataglyphis aenescens TaxID=606501 RepID=UPI001EE130BC|nr:NADH dehydrogenase subunit 5 [Cataglyphis aenescens]UHY95034.1 NADH dehydrogenase subunit 5 [Cataglyphis aenescens]